MQIDWSTLLGAGGGVVVIVLALIKLLENRQSLKNSAPRLTSEAFSVALAAQTSTVEGLRSENQRLTRKFVEADERAERVETELDELRVVCRGHEITIQNQEQEIKQLRQQLQELTKKIEVIEEAEK